MKTWKRLLLLCLTLALLTIALPVLAAETLQEGNFYYTVADGEAKITGAEPTEEPLIIPGTIGGYPVTKIGSNAFGEEHYEPYAVIPESVRYIDEVAFRHSKIRKFYIYGAGTDCMPTSFPTLSLLYCKKDALLRQHGFENVCFLEDYPCDPLSLNSVWEGDYKYAQYDGEAIVLECTATGEFVVPDTLGGCPVTYIGPYCFQAEELTVTLPETVRSIGTEAFCNVFNTYPPRGSLTRLPRELVRLGRSAIAPASIQEPFLPAGLTEVGEGALGLMVGDKLVVPGGIKVIEKSAFYSCAFYEIVLEEGIECIREDAFGGNLRLKSFTVPASVTECEPFLHQDIEAMVYGYVPSPVLDYCVEAGIDFTDRATGTVHRGPYYTELDGVRYYVRPGDHAAVSKLLPGHAADLVIPETVDGVPVVEAYDWAFTSETLKSLYLPDTMKNLNDFAVEGCVNLEYVRLSENLETIGDLCFYRCDKLKALYIPASVKSIRDDLVTYPRSTVIAGKAGSYAKTYAAVNNYPFVEMEEGKEYIIRDGVYRKEADGLVALSLPITKVDYSYAYCSVPDEIDGIPVVGIDGEVQLVGYFDNGLELYLGRNVRFLEKGSLTDTAVTVLHTTPALEELPVPLFAGKGEIYGVSGTYAESYAKEHGIFFYPMDSTPFTDVPEDIWFFPAVYFCYWNGIMNGTSDTTFQPAGISSRAMLVTTLYRLCGEPYPDGESDYFVDVPEYTWYTSAVDWAAEHGVVYGTSATTFSPNDPVTREQVATILYRLGDLLGKDIATYSPLTGFKDADTASNYAKTALMWAVDAGILQGNDKNMLNPKGATTRAEMATILLRYIAWLEA